MSEEEQQHQLGGNRLFSARPRPTYHQCDHAMIGLHKPKSIDEGFKSLNTLHEYR